MPAWMIPAIRTAAVSALALLAWFPPQAVATWPDACLYRRFLGVSCLGCGTTRAVSALLHGRVEDALALNMLCVPAVLAAAFTLTPWFGTLGRPR